MVKPPTQNTRWWIIVWILLFQKYTCEPEVTCPHGCKCDVDVVNCLHSNLTSVPVGLSNGDRLQELKLGRNKITEIKLELLEYKELRLLDLISNNISTIDGSAFRTLNKLETLFLSRNFITKTDKNTFRNLTSLRFLDLSYNNLRCLKIGNFEDLQSLVNLDLSRNQISLIEAESFRCLENLEILKLPRNQLDQFPWKIFQNLTSLKMLVLDDNLLTSLPISAFSNLINLEYLSLTGNRLHELLPSSFMMSDEGAISLEQLYLRGTDLDTIPVKLFAKLKKLTVLDLSKTQIVSVKNEDLNGLSSLESFIMTSSNNLTYIEKGVFQDLHSLRKIDISGNTLLSEIQFTTSSLRNLSLFDLSANSLTSFSRSVVNWSSDVIVDLKGNKFQCDCDLDWIPQVLPIIHNNQTKSNIKQLMCDSPLKYQGRQIVSLLTSEQICGNTKELRHDVITRAKVAAIAAGIASIVLVTLAMLIKFRKRWCSILRRQYRYSSYRNKNGVFTVDSNTNDINRHDDVMPMEEMQVFSDDVGSEPDVVLMTNNK